MRNIVERGLCIFWDKTDQSELKIYPKAFMRVKNLFTCLTAFLVEFAACKNELMCHGRALSLKSNYLMRVTCSQAP